MSNTRFLPAQPSQSVFETDATARTDPGAYWADRYGRVWAYLKAEEALEQGEAVMSHELADVFTAETLGTAAAVDSTQITLVNSLASVTAQMYVSVSDGTGEGQQAIIEAVDDANNRIDVTWITSDDGKLATALDTTSIITIDAPWFVKKSLATAARIPAVVAFAQIDVPINEYFWGLAQGRGLGRIDTAYLGSPAPVERMPLIPSGDTARAGQLIAMNQIQAINEGGAGTFTLLWGDPCAYSVHDNNADDTLISIDACCRLMLTRPTHGGDRWGYAPALT